MVRSTTSTMPTVAYDAMLGWCPRATVGARKSFEMMIYSAKPGSQRFITLNRHQ